ncbi:hypothetical protein FFK22_027210 [Mycobacterium sp. KBS0706]|uniref:hypothetical protein n=1 Tax=Mycobacterium sp. KBS0706 TaxID=2578109 RepID=UPI00110F9007|nr:hypothetical protein [Mycobacterium sp. KBS0706]TSD85456.1 hypothetical protein FFK22_027210 [Mycobacterium sp. KBS0706]
MSQICHLTYVVEPRRDGWTVVFGREGFGHFETRREALRSAGHDASFCRSLGHDVELHARRRDGRLRRIRIPCWDSVCEASSHASGSRGPV